MSPPSTAPRRTIIEDDAIAWLAANEAPEGASVVTSLPDVSELSPLDLAGWRTWFIDAARRVIGWTPDGGVSIFYQSDIRVSGALIDKGYLVMRAADEAGASLLWHKIVCRQPPGTIARGRPSYSHMIAVTRGAIVPLKSPGPDVLPDAGAMPWSRAMGVTACRVACRYLLESTATRVVVDPFCGRGTVLAVANAMGLDALGIDVSAKRCRAARSLRIDEAASEGSSAEESRRASLVRGARLFDAARFFDAHEVWEERWRIETDDTERRLFQGLIQIAAGLHKLFDPAAPDAPQREPASRLFAKGLAKLASCPERLHGVDLAAFGMAIAGLARTLETGVPDRSAVPRLDL
jgi:hypothetical protein